MKLLLQNELGKVKEQEKKIKEQKCFARDTKVCMLLQNLKLQGALEIPLRLV